MLLKSKFKDRRSPVVVRDTELSTSKVLLHAIEDPGSSPDFAGKDVANGHVGGKRIPISQGGVLPFVLLGEVVQKLWFNGFLQEGSREKFC